MLNATDPELIRLVQLRRRDALEALYDRYVKLVYSFALKTIRDESLSKEIVQQVFTRIWTSSHAFDPTKGQFTSWLLTVTRNIAIDVLRKERRLEAQRPTANEALDRYPAPEEESPEQSLLKAFEQEQVRSAYRRLTEAQQKLLDLFYWQGYTLTEIAEMTDEPIGTLKSRLHQSLKTLRRLMQAEGEG